MVMVLGSGGFRRVKSSGKHGSCCCNVNGKKNPIRLLTVHFHNIVLFCQKLCVSERFISILHLYKKV